MFSKLEISRIAGRAGKLGILFPIQPNVLLRYSLQFTWKAQVNGDTELISVLILFMYHTNASFHPQP